MSVYLVYLALNRKSWGAEKFFLIVTVSVEKKCENVHICNMQTIQDILLTRLFVKTVSQVLPITSAHKCVIAKMA